MAKSSLLKMVLAVAVLLFGPPTSTWADTVTVDFTGTIFLGAYNTVNGQVSLRGESYTSHFVFDLGNLTPDTSAGSHELENLVTTASFTIDIGTFSVQGPFGTLIWTDDFSSVLADVNTDGGFHHLNMSSYPQSLFADVIPVFGSFQFGTCPGLLGPNKGPCGLVTDTSFSVGVPGPIVGAGLPGLVFTCGGILAWWRRKKLTAGLVPGRAGIARPSPHLSN
jgi:hypothetical protein